MVVTVERRKRAIVHEVFAGALAAQQKFHQLSILQLLNRNFRFQNNQREKF
jgi:hypothetical protein